MVGLVTLLALVGGLALVYVARPRNLADPNDQGNLSLRRGGVGLVLLGLLGMIFVLLQVASTR